MVEFPTQPAEPAMVKRRPGGLEQGNEAVQLEEREQALACDQSTVQLITEVTVATKPVSWATAAAVQLYPGVQTDRGWLQTALWAKKELRRKWDGIGQAADTVCPEKLKTIRNNGPPDSVTVGKKKKKVPHPGTAPHTCRR